MGKIDFEKHRQPWETGAHWELKREFMEKYQDDFPEDRLLCLAQAYSNIELLHCSYPDPVMLQIHELSKSLNGCKHFRETAKNSSKDEPELQARPVGKRSASNDSKKPFKFIKFYSVGNQSSEDTLSTTTSENNLTETPQLKSSLEESSTPRVATPPNVPLDTSMILATGDSPSPKTQKSNNTEDSRMFNATTPSVVPSKTNAFTNFELSNSSTQNEDFILSLAQSPDFNLIRTFSEAMASLMKMKSKKPVREIDRTVKLLNLQGIVYYKFDTEKMNKKTTHVCKVFMKDTLLAVGRCSNVKTARIIAAAYAHEMLVQSSNLPIVTLSNLKCSIHRENVLFLHKFLLEATSEGKLFKRAKISSTNKILSIVDSLKCPYEVSYFFKEDLDSSIYGQRAYVVDLVINKVLICSKRDTKKTDAKSAAADQIVPLLQKFFEENSSDFQMIASCTDSTSNASSSPKCKLLPKVKENSKLPLLMDPNTSIGSSPCVNPNYFKINYRLLKNSMDKQFAIFDNSEITRIPQTDTKPKFALLHHSAQFCKKSLSFDVCYTGSSKYKCEVTFEGENIAEGEGSTKAEAKANASDSALKILEKQFYTIKVKSELDESFIIMRDQMMNCQVASDAVSDDNVGCKMLKMMGWTGGGIGKTQSGITEPITASEHRYQQGLGFSDKNADEKKFRRNIESLLKEFSQTDTTSDLIFSTDFTKDERKIIHNVATRFGLIGTSRGKVNQRQLFVRHKMSVLELLNYLLRAGGRTPKYELVDKST